jgi:hypothetical protein
MRPSELERTFSRSDVVWPLNLGFEFGTRGSAFVTNSLLRVALKASCVFGCSGFLPAISMPVSRRLRGHQDLSRCLKSGSTGALGQGV